jgi:hypothetical protein
MHLYLGLFLLAAGTLSFEIVLTRLFALAQGYHFAFMAVSLALLGAGASGTFLSLRARGRHTLDRWLSASALLFGLTVPASYLLVNMIPFDAYRIAWERTQLLWLAIYYLALAVPFFWQLGRRWSPGQTKSPACMQPTWSAVDLALHWRCSRWR